MLYENLQMIRHGAMILLETRTFWLPKTIPALKVVIKDYAKCNRALGLHLLEWLLKLTQIRLVFALCTRNG